jgi:hypothetical protein
LCDVIWLDWSSTFLSEGNELHPNTSFEKVCAGLFDDILVYSRSYEEHLQHSDQVLHLLQQEQWRVKMSKCSFAQRQITYLGYIISAERVSTCPDKIKAVAEWHVPTCVKELRSFLELA